MRSTSFKWLSLVAACCLLGGWTLAGCGDDDTCTPQPEECNGLDDDCDGEIDEGGSTGQLRRPCQTACGGGYEYCYDGVWEQCDAPQPAANDSQCNGLDDDCDGQIDEDCACRHGETRPCGESTGVCEEGVETCTNGQWGACVGGVSPANDDSLCNGLDDDCDGDIDEDCTCTPPDTQPCGSDVGICRKGTQTCQAGGTWGDCEGEVTGVDETCDGTDNDCNGEIDDGLQGDSYEGNDDCAHYRDLGQVNEDDGPSSWNATLYPETDVDFYKVQLVEGSHICVPFSDQCYFYSFIDFTPPPDLNTDDILVTVYDDWDGDCSNGAEGDTYTSDADGSWDGDTWTLALQWMGMCSFTDSADFFIEVEYANSVRSCQEYTITAEFAFTDEGCE